MKQLILALAAFLSIGVALATAGSRGAQPVTVTVAANGDLTQFPGALERVEIRASDASRYHVDLQWPGLELGAPYEIVWNRAWRVSASLGRVPLHSVGTDYAGSVSGTSAWSDGVSLTFFCPDDVTVIDDPVLLRRLQGRGVADLEWQFSDGGTLFAPGPNDPDYLAVGTNALGIEFEVTYYPATP